MTTISEILPGGGLNVYLYCRGQKGGDSRYLDGRTENNTVGLAPNTQGIYTGTRWHWQQVAGTKDSYTFRCLGDKDSSKYLDGRTQNGTVGLAPNTGGIYTGTFWKCQVISDPSKVPIIITAKCLGDKPNKNFQYLDGRTENGTVGLAPDFGGIYTGTHWQIIFYDVNQHDFTPLG